MKQPLDHQKNAIEAAVAYYQAQDRGQLVMACGTGKTLTSLWISEALSCQKILVILPNLVLMKQTVSEWLKNTSITSLNHLCVRSDPSVNQELEEDSPIQNLSDIDTRVTTSKEQIEKFIRLNLDKPFVIFSTYQSGAVLSQALVGFDDYKFDMTICDEAHRTTGNSKKLFAKVLSDKYFPAKKRLFMTATPRILSKHVMRKGVASDVELFSMSDENIFGKVFFRFSYGDAIKAGILVDYKVVISIVNNQDVNSVVKKSSKVKIPESGVVLKSPELAKEIAFLKAMNEHSIKHSISFHSKVKKAKDFCNGVLATGQLMNQNKMLAGRVASFHVNGKMNANARWEIIEQFTQKTPSLITNARCLAEGIDIPVVDGIFFHNAKYSLPDIVQATGRALRRCDHDKVAYLIVPVFISKEQAESSLENGDFTQVWQVVKAMQAHDERLEDVISNLRVFDGFDRAKKSNAKDRFHYLDKLLERILIKGSPPEINFKRFSNSIETKLLEVTGSSWDYYFGVLLAFREKKSNCWPRCIEEFPKGVNLGSWCSAQKRFYRKGKLLQDRIDRLNNIGFPWEQDDTWIIQYEHLTKFRKKYPDRWPMSKEEYPKGNKLGLWCDTQRQCKNKLSLERIRLLEEIGFQWKPLENAWTEQYRHLVAFREKNPDRWPMSNEEYPKGSVLGSWVNWQRLFYRKKKLSLERIRLLEEIGFQWKPHENAWAEQYRHLVAFREKNPDRWPMSKEEYPKGNKLGSWCGHQRWRKDEFSVERIRLLEKISFQWKSLENAWGEQYRHLIT